MRKNKKKITVYSLMLGSPGLSQADVSVNYNLESNVNTTMDQIKVGVLNSNLPVYLAGHKSHSSHRSHRSSSSGSGTYRAPTTKAAPRLPSPTPSVPIQGNNADPLGKPARPFMSVPPSDSVDLSSVLSDAKKRKNIILRVQLTLEALGFYDGKLDGVMGDGTRKSLNKYRIRNGIQVSQTLDIETLNSLGILAK